MFEELISNAWGFIALVIGFSFVVFVHELGHFIVAKWVGIKVTQFAIGFGHAIVSYRKGMGLHIGSTEPAYQRQLLEHLRDNAAQPGHDSGDDRQADQDGQPTQYPAAMVAQASEKMGLGETEYRFNWIPFGGYVKMLGQEDLDPSVASDDPRAFSNKPIWARSCVISAGVVMNIIFAVVFFIFCFLHGVEFPPSVVGGVSPTGPAANTYAVGHENDPAYYGIQTGDMVTAINGQPVSEFMEIAVGTALAARGATLEIRVDRDGEPGPLEFRITPRADRVTRLLSIGLFPPLTNQIAKFEKLPTEGPVADLFEQGVRPEMVVAAVADRPVTTYGQYYRELCRRRGLATPVTFIDDKTGDSVTVEMTARAQLFEDGNDPANLLGFVPAVKIVGVTKDSAAERAGMKTGDYLNQVGSTSWPSLDQVYQIIGSAENTKLELAVLRDGELVRLPATAPGRDNKLGFLPGMVHEEAIVARTLPGSPAGMLNLPSGSRIISVNGTRVGDWSETQRELQLAAEVNEVSSILIGYELAISGRPVQESPVTLDEAGRRQLAQARWTPAFSPINFADKRHMVKADTPIAAASIGIDKTHQFMLQTYVTLVRLFERTVPVKELRGPIGIAHIGTKVAQRGWAYLMFFLGLISVNLAVINFLPIPIVDGGHIVFLIIEKLKGSPVSPQLQTAAFFVGLAMIGSILAVTLFYDTARLFGVG